MRAVREGGCLIGRGLESHNALPAITSHGDSPIMLVKSRIPKRVVQDGS